MLSAIAAFTVTSFSRLLYFNQFEAPELVRQYPHDGQIGLEGFVKALNFGTALAVFVFLCGLVITIKNYRSAKRTG